MNNNNINNNIKEEVSKVGSPNDFSSKLYTINSNDHEKQKELLVSYDDALDECGFGIFQFKICFFGAMLILYVLNETMGTAFIMPASQCDLNLTTRDKGILTAIVFLGIMTSSHFWGYLGDTRGRKVVIMCCLICGSLITTVSSFINNYVVFLILRFFVGFFVSGVSSTSYAYIGEFVSIRNRAAVISWISVSVGVSSIFLPVAAWGILYFNWSLDIYEGFSYKPWRLLLIIYALPGLISAIWLRCFPESPRFLLSVGKDADSLKILNDIYNENHKNSEKKLSVKKLVPELNEDYQNLKVLKGFKPVLKSIWNQTVPLFKPPHIRYFAACCFLHFGTFLVASGLGLWFPEIMNRLFSSGITDMKFCQILNPDESYVNANATEYTSVCVDKIEESVFLNAVYLGLALTITYTILSMVIKAVGRRLVFLVTLFASGISGIVLLHTDEPALIVILFIIFLIGCSINVSVINGAAVNVFPTHLRAMAVCVSMLCGRLAGSISPNIISTFLDVNCELTFYTLAGFSILCGFVSLVLPN